MALQTRKAVRQASNQPSLCLEESCTPHYDYGFPISICVLRVMLAVYGTA